MTPVLAFFWLGSLLAAFVAGTVWEGIRRGGTLDLHLKLAQRHEERA